MIILMGKPSIYTMPSGVPFLPALAAGLRERLGAEFSQALILLPTRRAVRQLGEAFVGEQSASLLPRMRTLADIDPEEPPFEPGYLTGLVRPAMPPAQRRFALARIVARYHSSITDLPIDPAGMLALTDPLIAILDDAALEEVNLSDVSQLKEIEDFAARHFQNAATLYKIIQEFWPAYVSEQGLMEPMARRVALLNALTALWTDTPPDHPVIIAGSTGTLGASARLMRCVANMPGGLIVLPGLDTSLPESSWDQVGAEHPQNSLKNLLKIIGVNRGAVDEWTHAPEPQGLRARRRVISESLVPVDATADWPGRIARLRDYDSSGDIFGAALKGLCVVEANTDDEEALAIALMMREALETEDATAALVTPDPALARRVKARLRRWDIEVDYSQGEPLEETSLGSFLSVILRLAQDPQNPVDLAAMCKHPLCSIGRKPGDLRRDWALDEIKYFRGARPKNNFECNVLEHVHERLQFLCDKAEAQSASEWARTLAITLESVAATDKLSGAAVLWAGDAGESAASMLEELIGFGGDLGVMTLGDFARLVGTLMRGRVVRARFGMHPRLQILGPLEARMLSADRIILGGLNEGVWPAGLPAQPFLSRGMRSALGLSLPERRYGLAAHDFAELAAHRDVFLTRSKRADDGPRVASRWLWRLQTLVRGAMGVNGNHLEAKHPYLEWARALDHVPADKVRPAVRPAPMPPVEERWPSGRKLSVTQIRTWVRDPYAIYAKKILGLEPLRELDEVVGPREYGSAVHKGLEVFTKAFPADLPQDAPRQLARAFEDALIAAGFSEHHLAKERVRLARAAQDMTIFMKERRAQGWAFFKAESYGRLDLSEVDFTVSSLADLIEKSAEGYAVLDYKTGAPSTEKVIQAGFDPQLPLTALMLSRGAFDNVPAGYTAELLYVRVKGAGGGTAPKVIASNEDSKGWSAQDYQDEALADLKQLVRAFDKKETAYVSQPRLQYTNDYGDYDDLARRGEWAQLGDDGQGA